MLVASGCLETSAWRSHRAGPGLSPSLLRWRACGWGPASRDRGGNSRSTPSVRSCVNTIDLQSAFFDNGEINGRRDDEDLKVVFFQFGAWEFRSAMWEQPSNSTLIRHYH